MLSRKTLLLVSILLLIATHTRAAVKLDDLSNPSLQTLINLGSSGVVVDDVRFYSFSYLGAGVTPPTASQIAVQSADTNGLRFLSGWSASDGDFVSGSISFRIAPVEPTTKLIGLDLFSDAYAIVPGSGTFASLTETVRNASNTVLDILSNYNDGQSSPDTTLADHNSDFAAFDPTSELRITESLLLKSKPFAQGGGLATLSTFETRAVLIPEPSTGLSILVILIATLGARAYNRRSQPSVASN